MGSWPWRLQLWYQHDWNRLPAMPTIANFFETFARWCRRMRPIPSGAVSPVRSTSAAHLPASVIPAMGMRLGALLCVLAGPVQAQLCVSDCNGDGVANVNELVASVRIALDLQPVTQCRTADASGDHVVTIDELVRGVGKALGGCVWNRAFLRDEQGRALVLHGANVSNSAKSDPQRLPFVTRDDVMRLSRDFGFNSDRASRMLWLAFAEAGVSAPTEIYVPARRFYPDGFDVWVSDPDGMWTQSWDAEREILSVTTAPSAQHHLVVVAAK